MNSELTDSGSAREDEIYYVDLAQETIALLEANMSRPVLQQVEAWQSFYEDRANHLLERLYADYKNLPGGWHKVAVDVIFPKFPELLPAMKEALAAILQVQCDSRHRACQRLGISRQPVIVTFVGLGNAAGWATTWLGRPAVLLGLENIADLQWRDAEDLRGLIAHEIGHLFMWELRGTGVLPGKGAAWVMFEEGFAQYCEHLVTGRESWSCASPRSGWAQWCAENEAILAAEFLRDMDQPEQWRRFFGSWYDVHGWRMTGYYLGCRFVEQAAARYGVRELPAWSADMACKNVLAYLAEKAGTV